MHRKDVCSHKFLRDLMPVEQEWNGTKCGEEKKIHLLPGPTLGMPPPRTVAGMPEGTVCSPLPWKRHHETVTSHSRRVTWRSAESSNMC